MSLFIQEQYIRKESYVNEYGDTDYRYILQGETPVMESYCDSTGELFRACQKNAGRCTGRVYHDDYGAIGWVFEQTDVYEDTGEPYLLETWVTVHTAEPTRTVQYHYQVMEEK